MFFTSIRWWFGKGEQVLTVCISLLPFFSTAQVLQPQRYEIPLVSRLDNYGIVSASEHGLYLYRVFEHPESSQLHLIQLDTSFSEKMNGYIPVEKNYILLSEKCYQEKIYLLFRYYNYSKNDLLLYVVGNNGQYEHHRIRGYIPFSPNEIQVTDHAVLIGGYFNKVPVVLHYSLSTLKSKVLPGIFNESGELTQIKTYDDGAFDVLISAINHLKQRTIWLKNYDPDGNLNSNVPLDPSGKHLIFGRSLKTKDNTQLVAGVYGTRSAQYSHGVFIASIDAAGLQQIRFYQFADLQNFFKYMKAKREQRVKERIERRKIKGKKVRMNYRFLVHELVPYKDQFILLGEAFYPKYRSVDRTGYGTFFVPNSPDAIIQNGRIFEGYFYTHAIVMGFKPNGNLLWDNSFEINDVRTFTLEQFVKLEMDEDQINLLYLFDDAIRTKIIKNDQVLEGKTSDPIKTGFDDDIVKRQADKSRLEYWYNDYLFAYGIQEIEKKGKAKDPESRRVFYINKVKKAP